jgi:hypothetical protein
MKKCRLSPLAQFALFSTFALSVGAQEETAPTLQSRLLSGNQVELSWAVPESNFVLDSAGSMQPPVQWEAAAEVPVRSGGRVSVTFAPAKRAQFFRLRMQEEEAAGIFETSPFEGETGVAVTRETILRFSAPLSPTTVLSPDQFQARFGSRRILSRAELSADRATATLFYLEQLPASARIAVTFDGMGLSDATGRALDLGNNGLPGGLFDLSFSTSATGGAENTGISGHVYASEKGANGANVPLEGAIISVDGAEETLRTKTDAAGFFLLQPAPVGRFFVHVDGRTAKGSDWPRGAYYPFVGKAWETVPGTTNNLANGTGLVFLPLIPTAALTSVSATAETRITFPSSISATNPALAGVSITVPANSLFSENGTRGGKVGIAVVPPDRLPEPLPAGLNLPVVITIQTDGPMNFDRPVPVRFPNLPDPVTGLKLPPGAKTVLWSFNHDTGRWEPQGTATISVDGNFAETDPGVGVRQPGWHGLAPGSPARGPKKQPKGPDPDPLPPEKGCVDDCGVKAANYVGCWDVYYERFLKALPPGDPFDLKVWLQDKADKFGNCGDLLIELELCRGNSGPGAPCGGPGPASPSRRKGLRVANLAVDQNVIFQSAAALAELEQSYDSPEITWPGAGDWFRIGSMETGFEQRGRLNAQGQFQNLILAPNEYYLVSYYNPARRRVGAAIFLSANSGQETSIPAALLQPDESSVAGDTDSDGLSDLVEHILGTASNQADSDGDGATDGQEVFAGTNPLDGFTVQLGLLSLAQLPKAVSRIRAENNIAVLLDSTTSMIIMDIADPLQPVTLSQTLVAAPSTKALALSWPYAVIGGSSATVFDLSDPVNPVQKWTRTEGTTGAAIAFGRVYIANDQRILAFDLETGEPVPSITGIQGLYREMRILGDQMIVTSGSTLQIFRISQGGDRLQSIGKITENPWEGFFVEPGYAYVGSTFGYYVINISSPGTPVISARPGTQVVFSKEIIKDSGNRLISLTSTGENQRLASIYDQSSPNVATNFLTSLSAQSSPADIFIYRGRLFTASGTTLQVFNYREPDFGTNPPTVQLRAYTFFQNPPIEQSVGWFRLTALAQDDAAVRNVEFYIDGHLASDDSSHPFEADLRAPDFSKQKTNFTVRARAFDLAGNSTWSEAITIALTNELKSPVLAAFTPPPDSFGLTGTVFEVTARFTEALLESTFPGGFAVMAAGPDEQFDTADDRSVPFTITLQAPRLYRINLSQPLSPERYRISAGTNLTDFSGNPLANPTNWIFNIREPIHWVGGSGNWDDPSHWNVGRVPKTNDFVLIDPPEQSEITLTSGVGNLGAHEIDSSEPMVFQDQPTLEINREAIFRALVKFGRVPSQQAGALLIGGRSVYQSGIEINGNLTLQDHTFVIDSPGKSVQIGNYSISLSPSVKQLGSQFIIERGSAVEVLKSEDLSYSWIANKSNDQFINRGLIRKLGNAVHPLQGKFRNEGTLLIEDGTVRTEFFYPGFENLGAIEIRAGATFLSQGGSRDVPSYHGRNARFAGTGTNHVMDSVNLDCEYMFDGTTILDGDLMEFRGGVRNAGPWRVLSNPTIRGLFADFAGPVTLGDSNGRRGGLTFQTSGEAVLRDLTVLRGDILGQGVVRVLSPLIVSNSFRLGSLGGLLTVRFENTFHSAGRTDDDNYFQAGDARVEFARDVHWPSGPIELTTNCVILPGATFFAESGTGTVNSVVPREANRAGLAVEGTYEQNGTGTNRIQNLLNSGLVNISAGALSCAAFTQTAGELRLSGGALEALVGTDPSQIEIFGGTVTGLGTINGSLWVAGGALKPGLPFGIVNINSDLDIRADGSFVVDIAGVQPGINHDQVRVLGEADFRGRLEINLLNGFIPQLGQEFTIATFDFLRTEFPVVVGQNIGGGKRFDLVYTTKSLVLRVVASN